MPPPEAGKSSTQRRLRNEHFEQCDRYGAPEEIADAAAFLFPSTARYVIGQTLFVNGGFVPGDVDFGSTQAKAKFCRRGRCRSSMPRPTEQS